MSALSRLPVRLLAFNILLVFLRAAGILFLDTYERHLLEAQERKGPPAGRFAPPGVDEEGYGPGELREVARDEARGWGYRSRGPATGRILTSTRSSR